VAVRRKPTVRTDRPHGPDAVRYTSVDTATHRLTVTHADTCRDKMETARWAAFPQPAGRFRRWWQVLGSNQRRLSRRFYKPIPPPESHATDQAHTPSEAASWAAAIRYMSVRWEPRAAEPATEPGPGGQCGVCHDPDGVAVQVGSDDLQLATGGRAVEGQPSADAPESCGTARRAGPGALPVLRRADRPPAGPLTGPAGCGPPHPDRDPVQASRRRRSRPRGQQRGRGPSRQHAPRVLRRERGSAFSWTAGTPDRHWGRAWSYCAPPRRRCR
jgi:hypothetical protein